MTETSMTMVERVAERLLNVHRRRNGWPAAKLSEMAPEHRAEWLQDARAAIEAMREPMPEMLTLIARSIGETAGVPNHIERARQAWAVGIYAALSEEGE